MQIRLPDDKIYRYSIAVGWIRRAGSPAVASYRGQKPITFPAFAKTLVWVPHAVLFSRVKILFFDKIFLLIKFWTFLSLFHRKQNLLIRIFWFIWRPVFAEFEYDVVKGAEWSLESSETENLRKWRNKIAHFTFSSSHFSFLKGGYELGIDCWIEPDEEIDPNEPQRYRKIFNSRRHQGGRFKLPWNGKSYRLCFSNHFRRVF